MEKVIMKSLGILQTQLSKALEQKEIDTVYVEQILEDIKLTVDDLERHRKEKNK